MRKQIDVFEQMASGWGSPVVARAQVDKFTGGTVTARYIANLDCAGKGPAGRLRIGRKVVYPVAALVSWLQSRTVVVEGKVERPG